MFAISKYSLLILLLLSTLPLTSSIVIYKGEPNWIKAENRLVEFNDDNYLKGFQVALNVAPDKKSDRLQQLQQEVKNNLAESVSVKIESSSKLDIANASGASYENFKQNSTSFSNVNLSGVTQLNYYDEKKQTLYCFAYVKIDELLSSNRQRIQEANKKISALKDQIENYVSSENIIAAKKSIRKVIPVFREVEELYSVSIILGDKVDLNYDEFLKNQTQIEQLTIELSNNQIASINDLATDISATINDQIEISKQTLTIDNFTFEDTKMGSKFSRKLNQLLLSKFSTSSKFKILTGADTQTKYTLEGTVWEEDHTLRVVSILRNKSNGAIEGGSESIIAKDNLNTTTYKPDNLEQAKLVQELMSTDQKLSSGLSLDVITNKGNKSPIYEGGEIMTLYVKVNRPCKVRFIYHMADGTKVLLLDNFSIHPDEVNQMVKVSQQFECYPPFGVETLQVFAKTGVNFNPLNTTEDQGYYFINDDIQTINSNNRSTSNLDDSEVAFSEKRVVITTLPSN
ncbi:hypothetical protein [Flammeovirga pacifica]|uniref:DUF4384 domain-containing protein n=1 Tax=Flammeovirga pacifica TaxID=915059 RepID=A0A1S1YT43_FLAPC|nr:hypothetical protein [Flammeovirga pacifica]OHX64204.1 hypothetical protein NH26_21610 [Flammeovirga pacifica]